MNVDAPSLVIVLPPHPPLRMPKMTCVKPGTHHFTWSFHLYWCAFIFFPIFVFIPASRWEKRWPITQTGKPVNYLILVLCASLQYHHLCPLLRVKLWWFLFIWLQQPPPPLLIMIQPVFARLSQCCWWCSMVIFLSSHPIPLSCVSICWHEGAGRQLCLWSDAWQVGARLPAWVSLAAVPGTGRGSGTDVAEGGAGTSRDPPCAGSGNTF